MKKYLILSAILVAMSFTSIGFTCDKDKSHSSDKCEKNCGCDKKECKASSEDHSSSNPKKAKTTAEDKNQKD